MPRPVALVVRGFVPLFGFLLAGAGLTAQAPPGERPALTPPRITQLMVREGQLTLRQVRTHGLRVFASAFNKLDGYGDGPMDPKDPTSPGGRPTLQNNGTLLRLNGLDSQSCLECHSVMSSATTPARFGVGGHGGANNNAMAGPRTIDVSDRQRNGFAAFDGRFINPPFLFGAGGVELVAKEMTVELQALKRRAQQNPGRKVRLNAKGVDFGVVSYRGGSFDVSGVEGVDADLVVRPFGRKGEFATTRAFDIEALPFHLGLQPVEAVGPGVDADGDGVANEVLIGEVSALSIFAATLERPREEPLSTQGREGKRLFGTLGCATCHVPELHTDSPFLTFSFPEVLEDPTRNVYRAVDLRRQPTFFRPAPRGGVRVPMFSDLKRHDMGPDLAESTGGRLDRFFVTARLWGIADSAPYLHDGRALTLTDAILAHGGEARAARDAFARLGPAGRRAVLAFLRSLRTPRHSAAGLDVSSLQNGLGTAR